jgi:hypothetical protein
LGKCEDWKTEFATCVKKEVVFTFEPRLIDIETSRIVYSATLRGTAATDHCSDSKTAAPSDASLIAEARENALAELRSAVAPVYSDIDIELMDSARGIRNKEARQKFDSAIAFAKGNRMDRACELWRMADEMEPGVVAVMYGLGICAEVAGELAKADELYRKADRQLEKPDDRVSEALERVAKAKKDQLRFGAQ